MLLNKNQNSNFKKNQVKSHQVHIMMTVTNAEISLYSTQNHFKNNFVNNNIHTNCHYY